MEIVGDRLPETRMGNVMRGLRGYGHIAARELVLSLRARLDPFQLPVDGEIDRLVIADLEMQEGMVLDAAPVAAVERIGADEVDRTGDVAAAAARHHQKDVVAHPFADQREKAAVEIGAS